MAKTTTGKNGFFDISQAFGDFRIPLFDMETIVEAQRRNLEALTQANQIAVEGMRTLAQHQAEIVQQSVDHASALWRDLTQVGAPEERLAKTADAAKQTFERGVVSARQLSELSSKASADAFGVIARRVSESFDEVRLFAKKQAAAD